MTTIYRAFAPDLEVRSGGDGRTIFGLAVPWNAPQRIDRTLTEEWMPGAFKHQERAAGRVLFAREHMDLGGTLIGRMQMMRDDAAGLYVEMRAARTAAGDETLELVRDGALRDLSIGFNERPGGNRVRSDGLVQRVRADLREVAVVMQGAFGDLAVAAGVRSGEASHQASCPNCSSGTENLEVARQLLGGLPMLPA